MPPNRAAVLSAIAAKVSTKSGTNASTYSTQNSYVQNRTTLGAVVLSR